MWVNPRVSADRFSVQAGGMRAALPHCDALVSGHSFAALGEVADAIGGADTGEAPRGAGAASGPRARAVGERDAGAGQLGRHAERPRAEPRQHEPGMGHR